MNMTTETIFTVIIIAAIVGFIGYLIGASRKEKENERY